MADSMEISDGLKSCDAQGSPGTGECLQDEEEQLSSSFDGVKTRWKDRMNRGPNHERLISLSKVRPRGECHLLSLPVDIVLDNIVPCIQRRELRSLSLTCRALRLAILPQPLERAKIGLPTFSSGSKVDALIAFSDNFRRFFSSARADHVKALKFTSTTPTVPSRQSWSWERRAVELIWPHIPRLSIHRLSLFKIHLGNTELDGICSMRGLRTLSVHWCLIDVEEPVDVDPQFVLRSLDLMGVECTHPEFLVTALVNPDLEHLHIQPEEYNGVLETLLSLAPLSRVVEAEIFLYHQDGFSTLLPVIPNVVELAFIRPALNGIPDDFPLPPNAFPRLKSLTIEGIHYMHSDLVSHPLEMLEISAVDDTLAVQLKHAWFRCPSALSGLTNLVMSFQGHIELEHFVALMDMVRQNCTSLERIIIYDAEIHWGFMDFVREANLPASIRYYEAHVHHEHGGILTAEDISEISKQLSIYEHMEYFQLGRLPFDLTYDREVYGPLYSDSCREEFIRSMEARAERSKRDHNN